MAARDYISEFCSLVVPERGTSVYLSSCFVLTACSLLLTGIRSSVSGSSSRCSSGVSLVFSRTPLRVFEGHTDDILSLSWSRYVYAAVYARPLVQSLLCVLHCRTS
jgi:hypothetical protein